MIDFTTIYSTLQDKVRLQKVKFTRKSLEKKIAQRESQRLPGEDNFSRIKAGLGSSPTTMSLVMALREDTNNRRVQRYPRLAALLTNKMGNYQSFHMLDTEEDEESDMEIDLGMKTATLALCYHADTKPPESRPSNYLHTLQRTDMGNTSTDNGSLAVTYRPNCIFPCTPSPLGAEREVKSKIVFPKCQRAKTPEHSHMQPSQSADDEIERHFRKTTLSLCKMEDSLIELEVNQLDKFPDYEMDLYSKNEKIAWARVHNQLKDKRRRYLNQAKYTISSAADCGFETLLNDFAGGFYQNQACK